MSIARVSWRWFRPARVCPRSERLEKGAQGRGWCGADRVGNRSLVRTCRLFRSRRVSRIFYLTIACSFLLAKTPRLLIPDERRRFLDSRLPWRKGSI
jgi:hypothetical protein